MAEKEHEQRTMDRLKYDAIDTLDTQTNGAGKNVENCEQPEAENADG